MTQFRLARTFPDYFGAFRLLQRRYTEAGLSHGSGPIRIESFHFWEQSQVFIAVRRAEVVGCLTLVRPGNPLGLPLQHAHPDVFHSLPDRTRLAEVTSLAIDNPSRSIDVFLGLSQLAQTFALRFHINRVVTIVHPNHASFYQKVGGFQVIRDDLCCTRVNGEPGVALLGEIGDPKRYRPQWRELFSRAGAGKVELDPHPMTARQRKFFAPYSAACQRQAA